MRKILNNIIIPCSRIPNHPLGAETLNDILIGYKDMASRDKIWSLPELLRNDKIKILPIVLFYSWLEIIYPPTFLADDLN